MTEVALELMNRLSVSLQQSILTLHERGWSARRIARELGVHRETVGRELQRSNPAKVTPGSESDVTPEPAKVTPGSEGGSESKPAKVSLGSALRSRSQCEQWREAIEVALAQGLTARRIHQDLQSEHGYQGGY